MEEVDVNSSCNSVPFMPQKVLSTAPEYKLSSAQYFPLALFSARTYEDSARNSDVTDVDAWAISNYPLLFLTVTCLRSYYSYVQDLELCCGPP